MKNTIFKYVAKLKKDPPVILTKVFTLDQIEQSDFKEKLSSNFFGDHEIIDRLQYSGQEDREGNKIYEKDIVRIKDTFNDEEYVAMCDVVNAYCPCFDLYIPSKTSKIGLESYNDEYNAFTMDDIQITKIGNLYKNPGLFNWSKND